MGLFATRDPLQIGFGRASITADVLQYLAMSIGSRDVERIAESADADRKILHSLYCANCGFNLRYRKFVDRCPECNSPYNARPTVLMGIFRPDDAVFPGRDIPLILIALGLGAWILAGAFRPVNDWLILIGGGLAAVGLRYSWMKFGEIRRFYRCWCVRQRIKREEE